MRASSIRRAITLLIVLAVLRIMWHWVVDDDDTTSQSLALQEHSKGGDLGFRGRSCIVQGDKCIPHQDAEVHSPTKGLYTHGQRFYLDGRAFRILGGSFHYFRTQPAQWGDRLLKMKAAGLNVVTAYVPWNLHEKMRGQFNFAGRWDLASFIRQVDKVGLKMIIRPGPYICSEWDWGGLPAWLLRHPKMQVRSSKDKNYMTAVETYFSKLLPVLAAYQYKKGTGPIIAFQVENEFGSYSQDKAYMKFLKEQFEKYGINEMLITSDGKSGLIRGEAPGALKTVNFYKDPIKNLKGLMKAQPDKPLMVTEYWAGWFDHWGEKHHTQKIPILKDKLHTILNVYNASINFYMFVGGTNFEFWNGANGGKAYQPTITSYDYDAAISECGDTTPKYYMIKKMIALLGTDAPLDIPEVPMNSPKAAYETIYPMESMPYTQLVKLLPVEKLLVLDRPTAMEDLDINMKSGQGYGYLLYQKNVEDLSFVQLKGKWLDRAIVLYNNDKMATFDWTQHADRVPVHSTRKRNTIEVLVENMGRINFMELDGQKKGIIGNLFGDGVILTGQWLHAPLEFDEKFNSLLRTSTAWGEYREHQVPAAYRAQLVINNKPKDTFLDMGAWGKGVVIVNGFNIGRYWERGPQQALYIPAPLLNSGENEVIVFETDGVITSGSSSPPALVFSDKPILQCTKCRNPIVVSVKPKAAVPKKYNVLNIAAMPDNARGVIQKPPLENSVVARKTRRLKALMNENHSHLLNTKQNLLDILQVF